MMIRDKTVPTIPLWAERGREVDDKEYVSVRRLGPKKKGSYWSEVMIERQESKTIGSRQ